MRFRKALVPLDGSAASELVLAELPPEVEEVVLLHVVESHHAAAPGLGGGLGLILTQSSRERHVLENARAYLETLARSWPSKSTIEVRRGDPAREIVRAAEEQRVDLIALAPPARTCATLWLLRGVIRDVLRGAPCPVLVGHSRAG